MFLAYLDQSQPYSSLLKFVHQPCTCSLDKLVRRNGDHIVSSSSTSHVRDDNGVLGESSVRKVIDVLMVSVDDLG